MLNNVIIPSYVDLIKGMNCNNIPIANNKVSGIMVILEEQLTQSGQMLQQYIISSEFKIKNSDGGYYVFKTDLQLCICYYITKGLNDKEMALELSKISVFSNINHLNIKSCRENMSLNIFGLYSTRLKEIRDILQELHFSHYIPSILKP